MGQYYEPYLRFDDGTCLKLNSQNVIQLTADQDLDPKDAKFDFDTFIGLKLMEHALVGNELVEGVAELIHGRPAVVGWIGDYSDGIAPDDVYEAVWGDGGLPDGRLPRLPSGPVQGVVADHDKRLYVRIPAFQEGEWTIHPLPVLTALGNGRGGGDYYGTFMPYVGIFALDRVSVEDNPPEGYSELPVRFVENLGGAFA